MSAGSWQRAFAIFEAAVDLPPGERQAYLDRSCGDDEVRRAVANLLAADERAGIVADPGWAARPWVEKKAPNEAESWPDEMPSTIGSYRLLRRVGQGGMSTVYLAVRDDDTFRRRVVVKLVRRGMESETILRRLRIERQILASLEHPYVARLYDGGSTQAGLPYFVMEYVDGVPIDVFCEEHRLTVAARLTLFSKVCAAVHYAHQNLVVHRDIKPSNILVTADGNPKLLDFGIAKLLDPDLAPEEIEPTATWQRVMTPSYASPEQVRGQRITTSSDVYSLGVLLYQLLTGRLPRSFGGRSLREIERLVIETDPVRPSDAIRLPPGPGQGPDKASAAGAKNRAPEQVESIEKQLRGDLDSIVLKALRSTPQHRYSSVERFAQDVENFQRGLPVTARSATWRYRTGKFLLRHRAGVAIAGVLAVLLVGFAAAMAWQSTRVALERDQVRLERDKKEEVLALILDVFGLSNPFVLPGEALTVREALVRSVPVLEEGLRDQPDVRAELLYTSGSILTVLGDYQIAEGQLHEAYEIRRQINTENHGDIVRSLTALAAVRKQLGELEEAEALALRSVEIARGRGKADADLVKALNALVSVYCFRSQYEAAESPARDALALAHDLPHGDSEEITALSYLALIRSSQGDDREAAELYRKALAGQRRLYGEQHPIQINILNNLALSLRRQQELEAAERTYEELIELQRDNFGEDYKDPVVLANLASIRSDQGDFQGSQELYREAIEAVAESQGEEHWMVFVFAVGIEQSRLREGSLPHEVESNLRRLVERFVPTFGESHSRMAIARSILGESVSLQGRCEEAESILATSYQLLLERAKYRQKAEALKRLRDHFERCGQPRAIARYEAMGKEVTDAADP